MAFIFADAFETGTVASAPDNWTIDSAAWTVRAAPAGLTGQVMRAAQDTASDKYATRTFTNQASGVVALRFSFKTGSTVAAGFRWADLNLFDGAATTAARAASNGGSILLLSSAGTVTTQPIAINTVYTVIVFADITNDKIWWNINGVTFDNGGLKWAATIAGIDRVKASNFSPSAAAGEFEHIDDIYVANYATVPAAVPTVGTVTASGTVNGNTCGSDKNARIRLKYTEAGSGEVTDSVALYRASSSGGTFTQAYVATSVTGGGATWEVIDPRPAYGTPSIALGSVAYYKAKGQNVFGVAGSFTSEVNATSQVDVPAIETARATLLHSLISAQAGGFYPASTTGLPGGESYPAQWVLSMAYAYYLTGTAAYKTDAINEFNYIVGTLTNADGLVVMPYDLTHVARDTHFRNIFFVVLASRLIRAAGDATTANTWVTQCDVWAKAAFDKLAAGTPTVSITRHGWDADNASGQTGNVAWSAGATITAGTIRKPTVNNARLYRARNAGTTGGSQPTWPTTVGSTVADNGITWVCTSGTGAIFNSLYNNVAGYAATGAIEYDINQVMECATALLMLELDTNSAFSAAGTYRTKADLVVTDTVNLLMAFQISAGKLPIGDPIPPADGRPMYDTIYGAYSLFLAAIIYRQYAGSVHQDLPLWISLALDWFDTLSTEPLAFTHYDSSLGIQFEETELRASAYIVASRTNPLNNLWNTAAFNTTTDRWGWYSQPGSPSLTSPTALGDGVQARSFLGAAVRTAVIGSPSSTSSMAMIV